MGKRLWTGGANERDPVCIYEGTPLTPFEYMRTLEVRGIRNVDYLMYFLPAENAFPSTGPMA